MHCARDADSALAAAGLCHSRSPGLQKATWPAAAQRVQCAAQPGGSSRAAPPHVRASGTPAALLPGTLASAASPARGMLRPAVPAPACRASIQAESVRPGRHAGHPVPHATGQRRCSPCPAPRARTAQPGTLAASRAEPLPAPRLHRLLCEVEVVPRGEVPEHLQARISAQRSAPGPRAPTWAALACLACPSGASCGQGALILPSTLTSCSVLCVYYTVKLQPPGQPPQACHRAPHLRLEGRKRVRQLLSGGRGLEEHARCAPALRRRALAGCPPGPRAGRAGRCWAGRGLWLRRGRLLRCLGQGALKQAPLS